MAIVNEFILANNPYKQSGNSCYLYSYYYLISYFQQIKQPTFCLKPEEVFQPLLSFFSTCGVCDTSEKESLALEMNGLSSKTRADRIRIENRLRVFFGAVAKQNSISGGQVLKLFDDWLTQNAPNIRPNNLTISVVRCCERSETDPKPLNIIYDVVRNGGLVLFGYPKHGIHAVLVFQTRDEKICFKDSNQCGIVQEITNHEMIINDAIKTKDDSPFCNDPRYSELGPLAQLILGNNENIGEYLYFYPHPPQDKD